MSYKLVKHMMVVHGIDARTEGHKLRLAIKKVMEKIDANDSEGN